MEVEKRSGGVSDAEHSSHFGSEKQRQRDFGLCHQTQEPVFITRNGTGDMVVISMEEYERQQGLIDLYGKLAVAEQEIASGAEGEDFLQVADALRESVHGKL